MPPALRPDPPPPGGGNPPRIGPASPPIRNGISSFANWTEERYSDAFEREQLKSENEELKRQVAQLQAQARDAEAALEEPAGRHIPECRRPRPCPGAPRWIHSPKFPGR